MWLMPCLENRTVSNLLAKHLAQGLGQASQSELQRTAAAPGTSCFIFQMKNACSGTAP